MENKAYGSSYYQVNHATFVIPNHWEDRSVNVFCLPRALPGNFAMVITRDTLNEGQEEEYFEAQIAQLAKTLPQYREIIQREGTVDGSLCLESECFWQESSGRQIIQRQTYFFRGSLVFIFTATAQEQFTEEQIYDLNQIRKSFRFDTELGE